MPPPGGALAALLCITVSMITAAADGQTSRARVEARSGDLLAVGLVSGDRMSIHLSRLLDNAPVRDALVTVVLRGVAHPTTAEADGSFSLETQDLALPGAAAVEFDVVQGSQREALTALLQVALGDARSEDKNSTRQLWWWVLNFAVCIGFLWLYSRRRKAAENKESAGGGG